MTETRNGNSMKDENGKQSGGGGGGVGWVCEREREREKEGAYTSEFTVRSCVIHITN